MHVKILYYRKIYSKVPKINLYYYNALRIIINILLAYIVYAFFLETTWSSCPSFKKTTKYSIQQIYQNLFKLRISQEGNGSFYFCS